jgi:hypothetical protein
MNALQIDIISILSSNGALRTADICERLEDRGYGGTMSYEQFKAHITKTISKMKADGHAIGEDRPNPGTKPVRYWALPEPVVNDQMTTEMASDVAEVEQSHGPSLSLDDMMKQFEHEPDVEIVFDDGSKLECAEIRKILPSNKPMSAVKILREFANLGFEDDRALGAFMDGIAAAERHHGIAE